MRPTRSSAELPPERHKALRRAVVLEVVTLAYLLSVVVLMYLTMGNSQAMKTEWLEHLLSMVPPVAFLISAYVRTWPPSERFPYGYHRVSSIAFLVAALALLALGLVVLGEGAAHLLSAEHPTIGTTLLFGEPIWLGWLMFPVLLYSAVPSFFLGRAKVPLARTLHDKTLYADAEMNRADWMTSLAAMVGVFGLALGWWWADGVAAVLISIDIVREGGRYVWVVITDLMDHVPRTVDDRLTESFPARLVTEWKRLPWVKDADVRLREHGHVFFGEGFIYPVDRRNLVARAREARELAYRLDWRLQDLVIQMVDETPDAGDERHDRDGEE